MLNSTFLLLTVTGVVLPLLVLLVKKAVSLFVRRERHATYPYADGYINLHARQRVRRDDLLSA